MAFSYNGTVAVAIGSFAGLTSQKSGAIAIGYSAGRSLQGTNAIAIGYQAGQTQQGTSAIAIGYQAGQTRQGANSVAIGGPECAYISQGETCVAIGSFCGSNIQGSGAIAIGYGSGRDSQGTDAVAIGTGTGTGYQGRRSIAIGYFAADETQGVNAIAIGQQAAQQFQQSSAIAIGIETGFRLQGTNAIAIGNQAGYTAQNICSIAIGSTFSASIGAPGGNTQGQFAVAIGSGAGQVLQGSGAIAMGQQAGQTQQAFNAVAIGNQAGGTGQSADGIAIGTGSGYSNQRTFSIAIGNNAGYQDQESECIAIGHESGKINQKFRAVAIGFESGYSNQEGNAIAIGDRAGQYNQGSRAIAIGLFAGNTQQWSNAIAIGSEAGLTFQGTNAIAIGYQAGVTSQHQNSIIINATGSTLNSQTQAAFYAAPIRQVSAANTLYYDTTNKEIVYEGAPTIETMNMSNFGQTSKLMSIPYSSNQQITTSNITANLDNWADNGQTYTFGPKVQARYVAVGKDGTTITAKSINYSADGLNWYAATSPFNTDGGVCNGIAYNGTVWVAVGSNVPVTTPSVTVAYSYDGITWTNASGTTFNGAGGGIGYGVAWGKDKFVAVGRDRESTPQFTVIYSYDGINWSQQANPNIFGSGTGSTAFGVCYNGSRWVVVGGQTAAGTPPTAIVGYSADGISWQTGSGLTPLTAGGAFRSVAWNGTLFVMVGAVAAATPGTTAAYSPDGITWTATSTNVFGATNGASGFGVCWNGTRWVAVGRSASSGATTITISTSINGLIWTTVSTASTFNGTTGCGTAVCWTGTKFIAVGQNSSTGTAPTITVLYSYDGTSWFTPLPITTGNPFSTPAVFGSGFGIAYNSIRPNQITFPRNILVAGGSYVAGGGGLSTTLAYSIDNGTIWTACQNAIFGTTAGTSFCYCVATNGQIWVAGGAGSTRLGYSFDGIVWTAVINSTTIIDVNVKGLAWSPVLKLWVAVGTGSLGTNQVAYSYDGINWIGVTLPGGGFSGAVGLDVAWGEDKFVACGGVNNANTRKFYYSFDGKTWILVTSTTFLFGAYGIGFNGSLWVAVGNGNGSTAYSYDGITWIIGSGATFSSNDFNGNGAVAWNGYRWVVTSGTATPTATATPILYSTDGINWTAAGTPAGMGGCAMVWAGTRFIAGMSVPSTAVQMYTSPDGITWTIATTNAFGTQCNSIAWSNSQPNSGQQLTNVAIQQPTLAFGAGTNTIAYSYDGISWRGLGKTIFTTSGQGACWNGKIWVAGGISSTSGVIAYSYDGVNWTVAPQTILNSTVYSIAWNGTVFVAVGQGTIYSIAYSYNGINWLPSVQTAASLGITLGRYVTWGQNYFVATGSSSNITFTGSFGLTGSFGTLGDTVLTVTGANGIIAAGQLVTGGTGINVSSGTYITGPTGSATFTGSFGPNFGSTRGNVLTVSNVVGTIQVGQLVTGGSVTPDTYITGPTGGASFTGSISDILLTVTAVSSGVIQVGQLLSGVSVLTDTYITGPTDSATFSGSFVLAGTLLTIGTLVTGTIQVGQLLSRTGGGGGDPTPNTYITGPTGSATFTGSISGTILTVSGVTGTIQIGQLLSGGTVTVGTYIIAGTGPTWTVNNSQTATATTSTSSTTGLYWTVNQSQIAGTQPNTSTSSPTGVYWTVNNSQTVLSSTITSTSNPNGLVWTTSNNLFGIIPGVQSQSAIPTGTTTSVTGGPIYTVNKSQAANATATGTSPGFYNAATFTGSISGTTLTVTSAVTGTISIGQLVYGGNVLPNTYITNGSGSSWTVNNSQNVTSTALGTAGGGAAYSTDGINWTPITSAYVYYAVSYSSVIFAENRWLIYSTTGATTAYILYASNLTATNPWTYVSPFASGGSSYGITYGTYPASSSNAGTTYGTILIIGFQATSASGYYYSINGGTTWVAKTASSSPYAFCVAWNGKRFLFGNATTVDIKYITDPVNNVTWPTSLTSITNPIASQLFSSVNSFGTSDWPTLGSMYVDSALTTSGTSGLNTNNQLDIFSDTYFNNGYNNMAVTVKATQIP
jgi:hypothetical protein